MAANETTIAVSTRIGDQTNTVQGGFKLPAASTEEMILLSAQEITDHLNSQGANLFGTVDGLGILPLFKVEDDTHRLFAGARLDRVGVTFGGRVDNIVDPIIEQIATELKEESFGQFCFVRDDAGQFRRNKKGQFIILCTQRATTKQEDGTFLYQTTQKKLALNFNNIPNYVVDNRKTEINPKAESDPKASKFLGCNMRFFTVQGEISGLTEKELSNLAADRMPSAQLWNSIYVKLSELKPARDCKDWDAHWNSCKEKRGAAKREIKELYDRLRKEKGAFLIEPEEVFGTQNVEGALAKIFDDISSIGDYFTVLNKKIGNYSESPAITIVTRSAAKALANSGTGPLVDIAGNVITKTDGTPATKGFLGYAVKELGSPRRDSNPYATFPSLPISQGEEAPVQQAPAFRN